MGEHDESRRDFVKRAAYVAPAVLTLTAAPEYAKAGSVKDVGGRPDKFKPPKPPKTKVKRKD